MSTFGRVLIIDDDRGTRETVGDVLRFKGHAVETAARGGEGLAQLGVHPVDAAIVDIKLPDISGLELLRAIKGSSPETEVIFITGYASLPTAIQAINGTAFAYLAKPFEMDHLLATLDKALEKQRLARALRESEERYRLITENINDAVFLLDLEGRLVLGNRRSEELTGQRLETLVGRPVFSLFSAEGAQQVRLRLAADNQAVPAFFETEVVRPDGSCVWVEGNLTRVVTEGLVVGHLGVARDITERKGAEAELGRQREALYQREKLAAMGSLLAGVAHELNNPLSVVMGQTDLLREEAGDGPVAARAAKIALAADRCAHIVRNFLALARQHPPERHPVRLNQIVQEAMELMAHPLRVDNVEVALDLTPRLPVLRADAHQLHQVVLNLVSNAHQAMRETPAARRLTVTTRHDAAMERVSLEVSDTGPGIPPGIQPRIFEPFFTTKPPGQGTGLGLSLCHGVIEAHGGTIQVESAPGRGATFRIELPVEAPARSLPEPPPVEPPPPIRGKRILVVDDEPHVAVLLAEALSRDGHVVETAANGRLALEKIAAQPYDLIVSDLRMPELDGTQLYREVERRHPQLSRRFVFVTGDALGGHAGQFLEATGTPYLIKPVALAEVRQMVQRALRRHEPLGDPSPGHRESPPSGGGS